MLLDNKSQIIKNICDILLAGNAAEASEMAIREYPFLGQPPVSRSYTAFNSTRIFIRDGFLDRYSGQRLVFPATLRLLSCLMPTEFPAHPNWKMSDSHIVYWELFPTIDHIIPVTRGGEDNETNWVSASMIRNSAKSNWTLEELNWVLLSPGDYNHWDGLVGWFLEYIKQNPSYLQDKYIKRWHDAAVRALKATIS